MVWLVTAGVTVCMERKILVMRMGDLLPAAVWITNLSLKFLVTFIGVDKIGKSDCGCDIYLASNVVFLKPPSTFVCWKNKYYKIVTHHSWLDQYSCVTCLEIISSHFKMAVIILDTSDLKKVSNDFKCISCQHFQQELEMALLELKTAKKYIYLLQEETNSTALSTISDTQDRNTSYDLSALNSILEKNTSGNWRKIYYTRWK